MSTFVTCQERSDESASIETKRKLVTVSCDALLLIMSHEKRLSALLPDFIFKDACPCRRGTPVKPLR
jgi:hypothetical protein